MYIELSLLCVFALLVTVVLVISTSAIGSTSVRAGDAYVVDTVNKTVPDLEFEFTPKYTKEWIRRDMVRLLADFHRYTEGYFVACGTLLGLARHDGLIPWDDDLDVFVTELPTYSAASGLEINEFNEIHRVTRIGSGYPFVDVVLCETVDGFVRPVSEDYRDKYPTEAYPEEAVYPLQDVPFDSVQVKAPADPEACVKVQYGKDALTSVQESNWGRRNLPWFYSHRIAATL